MFFPMRKVEEEKDEKAKLEEKLDDILHKFKVTSISTRETKRRIFMAFGQTL